jgi:hypothetical protein
MKQSLVILISGLIIGILISYTLRCDSEDCPDIISHTVDTVYINKVINIPSDSIVYLPGKIRDTTIYRTRSVVDTIIDSIPVYRYIKMPIKTNSYIRSFSFLGDSLSVSGVANILADSLYSFTLDSVKFGFTEREITVTNTVKKKGNHSLYLSANVNFDKTTWLGQGINLYYSNDKLIIGTGIRYDFNTDHISYNGTLGLQLFNKK